MPRLNTDYSKTVIYKIICNDEDVNYLCVGSTTDFTKRKSSHKCSCNKETNKKYNEKKYVEIRNNGGWENFKMIQVEKYPCNDREAEKREEELRKELKANMNSCRCFITAEERKEQMKESSKKYRDLNKDKIKEYYIDNKEQFKEKNKAYRDLNKDKFRQVKKEYYEKNKDKIREHYNEKFECPCGGKYTKCNKSRHLKSKKHLESQNN